jgi:hypothetical protein
VPFAAKIHTAQKTMPTHPYSKSVLLLIFIAHPSQRTVYHGGGETLQVTVKSIGA